MRKFFLISLALSLIFILGFSGNTPSPYPPGMGSIKLRFITYNGFGNNLYIDNIMVGNRPAIDIAVTAVNNIKKDTTFLPDTNGIKISPQISVTNVGTNDINAFVKFSIEINPIGYVAKDSITSLGRGETVYIEFDDVQIGTGVPLDITVSASTAADTIHTNDTLRQNSIFLKGAKKNVLFEEWTSATSPFCGGQNEYLDTFINNNFSEICPVKYHVGFPPPSNDSMYLSNPDEIDFRSLYYLIFSVPTTIVNGKTRLGLPYASDTNLFVPFNNAREYGSPVKLSVVKSIVGNSVKADVTLNQMFNMPQGYWKLNIYAVERVVEYDTAIGASGEDTFYDVFRKMLPDTSGILIPNNIGVFNYSYSTPVKPDWDVNKIYFVVFVQNEVTREVINSAKSIQTAFPPVRKRISKTEFNPKSSYDINPQIGYGKTSFTNGESNFLYSFADSLPSHFGFQNFEGPFPPVGWTIRNYDGWITFEKFKGVNGISLGGQNSMRIPFYEYVAVGSKDTIETIEIDSIYSYDTLYFDYAYAQYLSTFIDSLFVEISTDGGNTYSNIFKKGGLELSTAPSITLPFYPLGSNQWRTFNYALSGVIPPASSYFVSPDNYELKQNYPNPFNPSTKISYTLPEDAMVTLKIYDLLGRKITELVSTRQTKGFYTVEFNSNEYRLASGIYYYTLSADGTRKYSSVKKMALIK